MGSVTVSQMPRLRWGIIGCGSMSSWFVGDLLVSRKDAKAEHVVQAIGSSSLEKGQAFVEKHCEKASPTVYASYEETYKDPEVDIIYVGTPHGLHKKNCLDAINAGKHVLCEKAFTVTAKEAEEVFAAAKAKGVYVMEAMWTRFMPIVQELLKKVHEEKVIGEVRRVFCDFGLHFNIKSLEFESRIMNPEHGAGSLLGLGVYSLNWGLLMLDSKIGNDTSKPVIAAIQSLYKGTDVASTLLLQYPDTGRQAILTSSFESKTDSPFCRIEGTTGCIKVEGSAASDPFAFSIWRRPAGLGPGDLLEFDEQGEVYRFDRPKEHKGYFYEADAVALDIAAGKTENAIMPQAETVRIMKMMDEIRGQGGAKFPQDGE